MVLTRLGHELSFEFSSSDVQAALRLQHRQHDGSEPLLVNQQAADILLECAALPGGNDGADLRQMSKAVSIIGIGPVGCHVQELEAAQLPRALDHVVLGQVSISYLLLSGDNPEKALIADGFGDAHYALQFVVRADRKDDPEIAKFIAIYRSPEVKDCIARKYGKFFLPVW